MLHSLTVYPKKYAHGFCFAVLCCGYTLTDFPISIRLTSLALWQSNDCPSASKATLMNMDKYFMWIHYERLHNHNKAKHNKTVCIFLGIYCTIHYCRLWYHHMYLTAVTASAAIRSIQAMPSYQMKLQTSITTVYSAVDGYNVVTIRPHLQQMILKHEITFRFFVSDCDTSQN